MSMTPRYVKFNEMMFTDDDLYYEARNALFAAIKGFQLREPPGEFEG